MTITVSQREFDHIIAALRVYQTMLTMNSAVCQDVEDIATEHGEQMTADEVGELCVRINCPPSRDEMEELISEFTVNHKFDQADYVRLVNTVLGTHYPDPPDGDELPGWILTDGEVEAIYNHVNRIEKEAEN